MMLMCYDYKESVISLFYSIFEYVYIDLCMDIKSVRMPYGIWYKNDLKAYKL